MFNLSAYVFEFFYRIKKKIKIWIGVGYNRSLNHVLYNQGLLLNTFICLFLELIIIESGHMQIYFLLYKKFIKKYASHILGFCAIF